MKGPHGIATEHIRTVPGNDKRMFQRQLPCTERGTFIYILSEKLILNILNVMITQSFSPFVFKGGISFKYRT